MDDEKRMGNLKNSIDLVCVDSYRVAIAGKRLCKGGKEVSFDGKDAE